MTPFLLPKGFMKTNKATVRETKILNTDVGLVKTIKLVGRGYQKGDYRGDRKGE